MGFGQSVRTCLSKYGTFSGRASRSEFWWFYLFNILIVGIPAMLGAIFFVSAVSTDPGAVESSGSLGGLGVLGVILYAVAGIAALALFIPNLAVGCRRLHDRGTSGWLLLLMLVPCASIVLLVFYLLEGTRGENIYGPDPTTA
jgi:uncharacterized membrane protein YhaH (DUF805 family)